MRDRPRETGDDAPTPDADATAELLRRVRGVLARVAHDAPAGAEARAVLADVERALLARGAAPRPTRRPRSAPSRRSSAARGRRRGSSRT